MDMLQIYTVCGVWKSIRNNWEFIVDKERCGRMISFESDTTLEELKLMVSEDYGLEHSIVDMEISYLPHDLVGQFESPPVIVSNNRQLKSLIVYLSKEKRIRLYVTLKTSSGDIGKSRVTINLNEKPQDPIYEDHGVNLSNLPRRCASKRKQSDGFQRDHHGDEVIHNEDSGIVAGNSKPNPRVVNCLMVGQQFDSKQDLKKRLEICAMEYNFDYRVAKSCTKFWCLRCTDSICNWRVRAECLQGSECFRINKYVSEHTCAPSNKRKFSRVASAKTIGHLIMPKYEGVKDGPRPNDIISMLRTEHGAELSYSKAWESKEFAVNSVRGLPAESFCKIPKYLHMLQEANPGTHTNYKSDVDGSFRYLFVSFGQCVRGFYKAIRRVIVVDATFLKSKYRGVPHFKPVFP